jgi:X-Pro dipeptidyl-peptidase
VRTLHRWFDHSLMGLRNGIDREPRASIETTPGVWRDQSTWPAAAARPVRVSLGNGDGATGTLGGSPAGGERVWSDNPALRESTATASPNSPVAGRVAFLSAPLTRDVRLSGIPTATLRVRVDRPTTELTARLVDYGTATRVDSLGSGEGITTLTTESCWGENRPGDDACYRDTAATTATVDAQVIARGWADLANHASLSTPRTLTPGTRYTMTFRLSAVDWTVPVGHRLALVVAGNDASMTSTPAQLPRVTVSLAETSVQIPLLGSVPTSGPATGPQVTRIQPDIVPGRLAG